MSDISTTSWSEVDASNSTTPPEGWPAGMFANAVEPSARMNMAAVKRFWNRINPTYLAALSTTDTFTVTETQARAGYSLNEKIATRFPSANLTTSPTVNHSALGAQLIKKWNGVGALVNVAVGDIQAQAHEYYWDGSEMVLTVPALSKSFTSAQQTISSAGGLTIAHGLGVQPNLIQMKLHNTSAELGYNIGDEVIINDTGNAGGTTGISIVPDATNLNVRFSSGVNPISVVRKDTGVIGAATNASWTLIIKAWA